MIRFFNSCATQARPLVTKGLFSAAAWAPRFDMAPGAGSRRGSGRGVPEQESRSRSFSAVGFDETGPAFCEASGLRRAQYRPKKSYKV